MKSGLSASSSAEFGTESGGESSTESIGPEKPPSHQHTYRTHCLPGLGNNPKDEDLDESGYEFGPGSTQEEESGSSCGEDDAPHDPQ